MPRGSTTSKRWILIALALLEGLLTLVLVVVFMFPKPYVTSWGEEIDRREDYIRIDSETLTQADLEAIASIRTLRSLTLSNCNLGECRLPELKFASHGMYELDLTGTTGLWDLSFLSSLPAESLVLTNCTSVDDISAINKERLTSLDISGTSVTDLSPLADTDLWRLRFANTEVEDISPLAKMSDLWEIDGSHTKVKSLDALSKTSGVARINFDGCPISELPQSLGDSYLHEVYLDHVQIQDFSALKDCEYLTELSLAGNPQITDLSWLNNETYKNLELLNLAGTGLKKEDLGFLSSCTEMKNLYLDGIALGDLDLCSRLHGLEYLSAVGCELTDTSGIMRLTELETLLLGYNHLTSAAKLPSATSNYPEMVLDLSCNELTSLGDLPKGSYRLILLQGNDIDYSKQTTNVVECYMVVVSWSEGIEKSVIRDSDRFGRAYVLDCPPSEYGVLDSVFYSYRLYLISQDELLYRLKSDNLIYSVYCDFNWYVEYAEARGDGDADKGEELADDDAEDEAADVVDELPDIDGNAEAEGEPADGGKEQTEDESADVGSDAEADADGTEDQGSMEANATQAAYSS